MDSLSFADWFSARCAVLELKPRHVLARLAERGVVRSRGTVHAWREGVVPPPDVLPALLGALAVVDPVEIQFVYQLAGVPLPAGLTLSAPEAAAS